MVGVDAQPRGERSSLGHRLATARRLYRTGGLGALERAVAWKLGFETMLVFECSLEQPPELVAPKVEVDFADLRPEDVEAYVAHRGPDVDRERAMARLRAGDRCIVAWREERIVSSRWTVRGALAEDYYPFGFRLPPGHAYTYDAWTSVAARGQRLSPAALSRLCAGLRDEGCTNVVSLVYEANAAGISTMERCGHHRTGWIAYRRARAIRFGNGRLPRLGVSVAAARAGTSEQAAAMPSGEALAEMPGDAAAAG